MLRKIAQTSIEQTEDKTYPYVFFGWFSAISYLVYYFIWRNTSFIGYENLYLRLVAVILSILLILKNYWPRKIKFLLPLYWYATITYCLPFLFTFLLLKNNFSSAETLNSLTILTLIVLLVEWIPLIPVMIVGISSGCLAYYFTVGPITLPANFNLILIMWMSIVICGAFFARNKDLIQVQTKLKTMKTIGASMAHELRTPLRTIASCVDGLKTHLPDFFTAYEKAKAANLDIPIIMPITYQALQHSLENIETETSNTFTIINMMLFVAGLANAAIDNEPIKNCYIVECINSALQRYPYDYGEKELIHWPMENTAKSPIEDFNFVGKELLIVHVLFNLMKNAFYYLKKAGHGNILIWLENANKNYELHFKDTGAGIPSDILTHIFDQFYSNTQHGTGIGLTFCKMVMQNLGGDIKCFSRPGEFTEFVLFFPRKARTIPQNVT